MRHLLAIGAFLLSACARHESHGVLDIARNASAANSNAGVTSEANLVGLQWVDTGKGFGVAARTDHIERYPCSRCHDRPAAQLKRGPKSAHWEVKLKHAPEGVMSCDSCHSLNKETDSLHSLRGVPIGFNESYRLCSQCHSRQATDWAGGAHGKRLGGWAPPRVIQACTGCHNPHQPGFSPRWPAAGGYRRE